MGTAAVLSEWPRCDRVGALGSRGRRSPLTTGPLHPPKGLGVAATGDGVGLACCGALTWAWAELAPTKMVAASRTAFIGKSPVGAVQVRRDWDRAASRAGCSIVAAREWLWASAALICSPARRARDSSRSR